MTNEEAIKLLSQIMDALLASNSWLPSTDNPIKESFGMAINALTAQESCNQLATNSQPSKQDDLISRQEVIDTVHKIIYGFFYDEDGAVNNTEKSLFSVNKAICNGVRELPSAPQRTGRWIPCSERLPKKNGFYLCTTKDCITILEFIEGNPHYHEEPSFVSDVLGKCNSYVIAWLPLPECYREGRE